MEATIMITKYSYSSLHAKYNVCILENENFNMKFSSILKS